MSSESIIAELRARITESERELVELGKLIDIMQKAGEDVSAVKAQFMNVKLRIDRYKKALA